MRRPFIISFLLAYCLCASYSSFAQSLQWIHNPTDTATWVRGSSRNDHRRHKYVDDTVVMNTAAGSENNYMYNTTPVTLAGTSSVFNASFDFRIDSNSNCSDGLSFWFFTQAGTNFSQLGATAKEGGAMGFPGNVSGFVLSFKTLLCTNIVYMKSVNATSFNWSGGSAPTDICTPSATQPFLTDGNWHHVEVVYDHGNITTTFDAGLLTLSGFSPITGTGYFGFMATSGGGFSRKCLKNISINNNMTEICVGNTTTLPGIPAGGSWNSSTPSVATIDPASGGLSGISPGTSSITYTPTTGPQQIQVVTVYPTPAPISGGNTIVCQGTTVTLTETVAGGNWSLSNSTIGSISTGGAFTGLATGVDTVTYAIGVCRATTVVSVHPTPTTFSVSPATTGTCGYLRSLTISGGASSSYSWTASAGLFVNSLATVPYVPGTYTRTVYALPAATTVYTATATITPYNTCSLTATATVNVTTPPTISGTFDICRGTTTSLSVGSGGTWSSSNTGVGTVSTSGIVSGISAGTTMISYVNGLCNSTAIVTVHDSASDLNPPLVLCPGGSATLTATPAGGNWSSSNATVAPITPSGVVTWAGIGSTNITYSFPWGCGTTASMTLNPFPPPISSGPTLLCNGATASYTDPSPGGFWYTYPTGFANIDVLSGVLNAVAPGITEVRYYVGGCPATRSLTVVVPPAVITGPDTVCSGLCVALSNTSASSIWTTSNASIATVNASTGIVCGTSATGGSVTITYGAGPGCETTHTMNVIPTASAPAGPATLCQGSSTAFTHSVTGGIWESSNTSVATVDPSTGLVTGVAIGSCTISYTIPGHCAGTRSLSVIMSPGTTFGPTDMCNGTAAIFVNAVPGGTWSGGAVGIANVSITGTVTAISPGSAHITYTLPNGCFTAHGLAVTSLPLPISGTFGLCTGDTTSLLANFGSGTWSSTTPAVASISTAGLVTANAVGTAMIYYVVPSGCFDTAIVTVDIKPTPITGLSPICAGTDVSPASSPAGGLWSSRDPSVADIFVPGVIHGVSGGTSIITYTMPSGCTSLAVATVNALPDEINSVAGICSGTCVTLSSTTPGGIWSVSSPPTASINSTSGALCGLSAGTVMISYTDPATGCYDTMEVAIHITPSISGGSSFVCAGSTLTYTGLPIGGSWLSSDPAKATVLSGLVTGIAPGTVLISYISAAGCVAVRTLSVGASPAAISGPSSVCSGTCAAFTGPSGGAWSVTAPTIGVINASTGMYCGSAPGTTGIVYTMPNGCNRSATLLVKIAPTAISPSPKVCEGLCNLLTGSPAAGTWSGGDPAVGTIAPSSGQLCGIVAGTTVLTYTLSSLCAMNVTATVYPLPAAVTGNMRICATDTTLLACTTPGGTWSGSNAVVAVSATTGRVTGLSGGTAFVSYISSAGCISRAIVTVDALPGVITGLYHVCVGDTVGLHSTSAGTWAISNTSLAQIATNGVVIGINSSNADTVTVGLTGTNGCRRMAIITVNALPSPISGPASLCQSAQTTLTCTPAGGTWSTGSSSIATIGPVNGVATGITGSQTATLTYTLPSGCRSMHTLSIDPTPGPLSVPTQLCAGASATLTSAFSGGMWSSSAPGTAAVDASGALTAQAVSVPSTATITYTVPTSCYATANITIMPLPGAITGTDEVCEAGATVNLNCAPSGGSWTSNIPTTCSVNATSGQVMGLAAGSANITYSLPSSCYTTRYVTVHPLPSIISGPSFVCMGTTITLNSLPAGGTWSAAGAQVSMNSVSGIVTPLHTGITIVSYTAPTTGCVRTTMMTVRPDLEVINGLYHACLGTTVQMFNSTPGGTWSSSNTAVASTAPGGYVTGISPGTAIITYNAGCKTTAVFTVHALAPAITGNSTICANDTALLENTVPLGSWSSSDPTRATVDPSGLVSGVSAGNVTISYVLTNNCVATRPMVIKNIPTPITGPSTVCVGSSVTLTSTPTGGTWSASPGSEPFGTLGVSSGTVSGISPGTIPLTYTMGNGCHVTSQTTVFPVPPAITGDPQMCVGRSVTLTEPSAGQWHTGTTTIATIGISSGIITGISAGTTIVTYTDAMGCNSMVTATVYPLPAPLTGNNAICTGNAMTLSSAPFGGTWSSNAPATATVNATTGIVSALHAGTTRITYTLPVTGCLQQTIVTVSSTPSINGTATICDDASTTYTTTVAGGAWTSSNASVATLTGASGSTVTLTGIAPGTATISYRIPATGCATSRALTVTPLPTVYVLSGSGAFCETGAGLPLSLSGSQTGINYVLYNNGTAGPSTAGTGSGLTLGPVKTAGTYTVRATVVATGCKQHMAGSAIATAIEATVPSVTISTSADTVCQGQPITATALPVHGGSAPAYAWRVNGTDADTGPVFIYTPHNADILSVTMTSNESCVTVAKVSAQHKYSTLPTVTPSVSISAQPGDTVCAGTPVSFTANTISGGTAPLLLWAVNGIFSASGPTPTLTPNNGDVVTCSLLSNTRCHSADTVHSAGLTIHTEKPTAHNVHIFPFNNNDVVAGAQIVLSVSVTPAISEPRFQWTLQGNVIAGATSRLFMTTLTGTDTVVCTVYDNDICTSQASDTWTFFGTTPTPGGTPDLAILPNPSNGRFTIRGNAGRSQNELARIFVTDMLGQKVYSGMLEIKGGVANGEVALPGSTAKGTYILTIQFASGPAIYKIDVR